MSEYLDEIKEIAAPWAATARNQELLMANFLGRIMALETKVKELEQKIIEIAKQTTKEL